MPVFGRCEFEELGGRCWRVYYDEDNPEKWLRDEPTSRDEALALPEDGLGGHQWTEGRLDILLGGTPRPLDGGPRRTASRFFFAFPSKAKVKLAVGALEAQGFQIFDIFQAEKDDWSVIAEKEIGSSHSLDALDGPDGELEVIAQMAGGTYNGYERPT